MRRHSATPRGSSAGGFSFGHSVNRSCKDRALALFSRMNALLIMNGKSKLSILFN